MSLFISHQPTGNTQWLGVNEQLKVLAGVSPKNCPLRYPLLIERSLVYLMVVAVERSDHFEFN